MIFDLHLRRVQTVDLPHVIPLLCDSFVNFNPLERAVALDRCSFAPVAGPFARAGVRDFGFVALVKPTAESEVTELCRVEGEMIESCVENGWIYAAVTVAHDFQEPIPDLTDEEKAVDDDDGWIDRLFDDMRQTLFTDASTSQHYELTHPGVLAHALLTGVHADFLSLRLSSLVRASLVSHLSANGYQFIITEAAHPATSHVYMKLGGVLVKRQQVNQWVASSGELPFAHADDSVRVDLIILDLRRITATQPCTTMTLAEIQSKLWRSCRLLS